MQPSHKRTAIEWENVGRCLSFGDGGAEITRVALYSNDLRRPIRTFEGGEDVAFLIEIEIAADLLSPIVGFILKDDHGNQVLGIGNNTLGKALHGFLAGRRKIVKFEFTFPRLRVGSYSFSPAIADGAQNGHSQLHWVHDAYIVQVDSGYPAARMGWSYVVDARLAVEDG